MPGWLKFFKRGPSSNSADYFSGMRRVRYSAYKGLYRDYKKGQVSKQSIDRTKARVRNSAVPTELVKLVSRQNFKPRGFADRMLVQKVLDWMGESIEYVNTDVRFAEKMYGKLRAEDIIDKKKIPTIFNEKNEPVLGCGEVCDAFIALLRTLPGIEGVRHVRVGVPTFNPVYGKVLLIPHSVVTFFIPEKTARGLVPRQFLADPFYRGQIFLTGETLVPLEGELARKIEILKRFGLWREGNNLRDFNKTYNAYSRERHALERRSESEGKQILEAFQGG